MRRTLVVAVIVVVLLLHGVAAVIVADRPMHYDENEYLHAGWLMGAGKQIYRDFFEDHPPHLFALLRALIPDEDVYAIDVRAWTERARLVSAFFGTAVVALVMVYVWRMTRDVAAAGISAAILLSSAQIWTRGLCDIRAEAPTLALFWAGIVLLTWSHELVVAQAIRAGAGIGLVFFAMVWNPKWPVEAVLLGVYFVWYVGRLLRNRRDLLFTAIAPAIIVSALAVLPILTTTTFADYLFFNYTLKRASVGEFAQAQWVKEAFARAPVWASTNVQFRWWWIALALVVVLAARAAKGRLAWIAIALNVAALLEFRFVYPYPYLWAQYLVMIATASAVLYALVPGAVAAILKPLQPRVGRWLWLCIAAAISIATTAFIVTTQPVLWVSLLAMTAAWLPTALAIVLAHREGDVSPIPAFIGVCAMSAVAILALGRIVVGGSGAKESWNPYWQRVADLQKRTGRGGTVFISPPLHPVAAHDASYYWYSFKEATPFAIRYAAAHPSPLPQHAFRDFPPCRIPANLRFAEVSLWTYHLEGNCQCVESAWQRWQLKPTEYFSIFETNADRSPLTPRASQWAGRTAALWGDFCSHRKAFPDERYFNALAGR